MNHTPEQQWSALSALYEEADALPAPALSAWLAKLEREGHPLLPQLKRMLQAREQLETDDFLRTLPKLAADEAARASGWAPGRRVGPYRLMRPLGEGGMAEVWLAERADGAFKRQVAIKLPYPRPGRESFAARFDRERDILATLRHPHIAGLFDAGVTADGQAWLALEYVEGQPISRFCDERRLAVRERVQLFRQVLLAVQHAHANLVIHRDLKPANILVTPQGEVRLLDFGIAKLLEAEGDAIAETELTRQAGRTMTPRYASPEQLTGVPLTTACDVYSLGVVFYELMCGERPYELKVESPAQLEHAILEVEPREPSRRQLRDEAAGSRGANVKGLRRQLAPDLDAIALRCLAKKPSGRYSSVDAVLADVDRWLAGEAVLARTPGTWYRFAKFANRHRWGVGLGIAASVSLATIATVAVFMGVHARQESARAIAARDFMLSLFKRADQEKSRGADITARELLESGRRDVMLRLAGQPSLQAELLKGIGVIQMDMGEYANAEKTFAEAGRIFEKLGVVKEAGFARIARAESALRMGDAMRAETYLTEARNTAEHSESDHDLNAYITEVAGWIANIKADAVLARDLFRQSRQYAVAASGPDSPRAVRALRGLIYAERQLRNFDEALALQSELESSTAAAYGLSPRQGATSDAERGDLLLAAGRYAAAYSQTTRAVMKCRDALGPNDEACRRLLLSRVAAALKLGFMEDARNEVPHLLMVAEDRAAPALQIDALLLAFRVEVAGGESSRRAALADQVRTFGQSGPEVPINTAVKTRALLILAEAGLLAGAADEAQHWLDLALEPRHGRGPTPTLLQGVGKALKGVSLLQQNKVPLALEWLRNGQGDIGSALGLRHPLTQLFQLNTAIALDASGRSEDARVLVNDSEAILEAALGRTSPTFGRVLELKERIERRLLSQRAGSTPETPPSHRSPDRPSADFFS